MATDSQGQAEELQTFMAAIHSSPDLEEVIAKENVY
jgi:hypothetical protein